jgi:hypothetical protein
MRFSRLAILFLTVAALLRVGAQQQPAPQTEPSKTESVPSPDQAPADSGPPVDAAKVTGSTFGSQYFKFTYELPKGWKTLDDAERVADNRRLSEEDKERSTARLPAPKKGSTKVPVKKNPALALPATSSPEHYSLMVASPTACLRWPARFCLALTSGPTSGCRPSTPQQTTLNSSCPADAPKSSCRRRKLLSAGIPLCVSTSLLRTGRTSRSSSP